MRIQRLPPHVANQIAAGEVIERPASVVKELLENAVDAGAQSIHIEIGFGGLNLIKVSDNGQGIDKDDLILAVSPHATSKITQLQDLYRLDSMGFRGEALASIASISRLRLSSKPPEQSDAMMLQWDEEKGMHLLPTARNQGTTVEVNDLFYNAPVRKKFLKSERLEFQAIETVVKRFALSAPHVAIYLKHNEKEILTLPAVNCFDSERLRIKKLFGKSFIEQSIYIETDYDKMSLRGWISDAAYQRSQRDKQWIYLNRRMVQDRLLQHAIQQAYQALLHPGRFASCLLYLTLPSEQVDVNVHPTKHEVRFQEPRMIHDFIVSSVSRAMESPISLPASQQKIPEKTSEAPVIQVDLMYKAQKPVKEALSVQEPEQSYIHPVQELKQRRTTESHMRSWYVVNSQFVLVPRDTGIVYLVNIERAYQALCRAKLMLFEDVLPHRPLLVPLSISIQKKNHALFEQRQSDLQHFGIYCDFLSETTLLVRTIPQCLPQLNLLQFFEMLEQKNHINEDDLFEMITICQSMNVHACQEDEKLELLHFLHQQQFPTPYCRYLDEALCLNVMSHA